MQIFWNSKNKKTHYVKKWVPDIRFAWNSVKKFYALSENEKKKLKFILVKFVEGILFF